MIKSPIGAGIAAAALLLACSPGARKTVRKWAVKATEVVLDFSQQAKEATAGAKMQLQSAVKEAPANNLEPFP